MTLITYHTEYFTYNYNYSFREDIETVNDESTAEESDDENKSISKSEDSSTKDIKLTNQHNIKNDTNDNDDEEFENNPNLVSYDWTCVADIYSNETL